MKPWISSTPSYPQSLQVRFDLIHENKMVSHLAWSSAFAIIRDGLPRRSQNVLLAGLHSMLAHTTRASLSFRPKVLDSSVTANVWNPRWWRGERF